MPKKGRSNLTGFFIASLLTGLDTAYPEIYLFKNIFTIFTKNKT